MMDGLLNTCSRVPHSQFELLLPANTVESEASERVKPLGRNL